MHAVHAAAWSQTLTESLHAPCAARWVRSRRQLSASSWPQPCAKLQPRSFSSVQLTQLQVLSHPKPQASQTPQPPRSPTKSQSRPQLFRARQQNLQQPPRQLPEQLPDQHLLSRRSRGPAMCMLAPSCCCCALRQAAHHPSDGLRHQSIQKNPGLSTYNLAMFGLRRQITEFTAQDLQPGMFVQLFIGIAT